MGPQAPETHGGGKPSATAEWSRARSSSTGAFAPVDDVNLSRHIGFRERFTPHAGSPMRSGMRRSCACHIRLNLITGRPLRPSGLIMLSGSVTGRGAGGALAGARSGEVGTGSPWMRSQRAHVQAKWAPVRRGTCAKPTSARSGESLSRRRPGWAPVRRGTCAKPTSARSGESLSRRRPGWAPVRRGMCAKQKRGTVQ